MTIEREALKLALEALEGADQIDSDMQAAITAIKQALAPPEQEPWCMKMNGCKTKCEDCPVEVAQPEQAPTGELHSCPYAEEIHGDYETLCDCDEERTRQCAQDI